MIECSFTKHGTICISFPSKVPSKVNRGMLKIYNPSNYILENVTSLSVRDTNMEKIPAGLGKIFKSIQSLYIENANLKSISKEDLRQFPELSGLNIQGNPLETLPGDLFEFNKDIRILCLGNNNIKFIGVELLDELPKLQYALFTGNDNIDDGFDMREGSREGEMKLFKQTVLKDCQPPALKSITLREDLENFLKQEEFKDFTIKVGEVNFKVHKIIFMSRSATFADLIKNNPNADELVLTDIPVEIFESILKFIYTDEIPMDVNSARKIYSAAGKLKIEGLKRICSNFLVNEMKKEKNLNLLMENFILGSKLECQEVKLKAFDEIRKHFPDKRLKDELMDQPETLKKMIDAKIVLDEHLEENEGQKVEKHEARRFYVYAFLIFILSFIFLLFLTNPNEDMDDWY